MSVEINSNRIVAARQNRKEKDYWLERLSGEWERSSFPAMYSANEEITRPSVESDASFHEMSFCIEGELFRQLNTLTRGDDALLHLYLLTALNLLLAKYTRTCDIIVGTPIYKQDNSGEFINTMLPLRTPLKPGMTIKELIILIRKNLLEAVEHQNFPLEQLLPLLGRKTDDLARDFPLFDVTLTIEGIHETIQQDRFPHNLSFYFDSTNSTADSTVKAKLKYNAGLYRPADMKTMINSFLILLENAVRDLDQPLEGVEMLSMEEKTRILETFNNTHSPLPENKTVYQLFRDQALKTPKRNALCVTTDLEPVFEALESEDDISVDAGDAGAGEALFKTLRQCCFQRNPYIFSASLSTKNSESSFTLLKTHHHNSVVAAPNVITLLELMDGTLNAGSIFESFSSNQYLFTMYPMETEDVLEIDYRFTKESHITVGEGFSDFFRLIRLLYRSRLIELTGLSRGETLPAESVLKRFIPVDQTGEVEAMDPDEFLWIDPDRRLTPVHTLLLGDTTGMSTVGLLYLASYLRRNDISAVCQFYDPHRDRDQLKKNLEFLLEKLQPKVVGLSMKWFPHIERVIRICGIVRNCLPDVKIVVGGNTASYFPEEIFDRLPLDYLIRGDGELPLLQVCRGDSHVQNAIYRDPDSGEKIVNPISYVQSNTTGDVYLSHLDEILLSTRAPLFGSFFIHTHKGCPLSCLYCGGTAEANKRKFNRTGFLKRSVELVRNDILAAKPYASTFFFDFDSPNQNLVGYCREIWKDIDLKEHYIILGNLVPPSTELIDLVQGTFKYAYWNLDMASLSERHRRKLFAAKKIKPQPTNKRLASFFTDCAPVRQHRSSYQSDCRYAVFHARRHRCQRKGR